MLHFQQLACNVKHHIFSILTVSLKVVIWLKNKGNGCKKIYVWYIYIYDIENIRRLNSECFSKSTWGFILFWSCFFYETNCSISIHHLLIYKTSDLQFFTLYKHYSLVRVAIELTWEHAVSKLFHIILILFLWLLYFLMKRKNLK